MIDIASEKLLTLEQAAEKLQVSKPTVVRWIKQGADGIRLEAIKFGCHWRTSEEAIQRFGDSQTPSFEPKTKYASHRNPYSRRQREFDKADEELDEALGIRKCETCRKVIDAGCLTLPKKRKLWCPKCIVQRKSTTMGERILTFRWHAQLSKQELYKRTGISPEKLRAYEADDKKPNEEHLKKLLALFGSDLVFGLDEVDDKGI